LWGNLVITTSRSAADPVGVVCTFLRNDGSWGAFLAARGDFKNGVRSISRGSFGLFGDRVDGFSRGGWRYTFRLFLEEVWMERRKLASGGGR
jgi:hypothetical protein